jgi:uncharacterized membrane protein
MPDQIISTLPQDNLVRITHIIYALHTLSVVMGFIGSAFIITTFLTGWPSIIAVIINYIKRGNVRGTFLDSHFGWQIRTFWYALLWMAVAAILFLTVIGIIFAYIIAVGAGIWISYRIIRGWIALSEFRSMPV